MSADPQITKAALKMILILKKLCSPRAKTNLTSPQDGKSTFKN